MFDSIYEMFDIKEARLLGSRLANTKDHADAANIILSHLSVEPDFLRSAPHTLEGVTEWFERKHLDSFWFAEEGTVRVGMIGLSRHAYEASDTESSLKVEICRLMVSPEVRSRGIGRELFQTALDACNDEGPWLTVLVGSDAEKMYRAWGWESLGSVPSQDDPLDRVVAMHLP
jgi:GNAT superfamily N-acetyltransferase